MKRLVYSFLLISFLLSPALGQQHLNMSAGLFAEAGRHPGLVLGFELDPGHHSTFSLPLRVDLTYYKDPDYHAFMLDLHKGFRKSFASGFFLEQSVGIGLIAKSFQTEQWYIDEYVNGISHGGALSWGLMPSLTAGLG